MYLLTVNRPGSTRFRRIFSDEQEAERTAEYFTGRYPNATHTITPATPADVMIEEVLASLARARNTLKSTMDLLDDLDRRLHS